MAMSDQDAAMLEYLMSEGAQRPKDKMHARKQMEIDRLRRAAQDAEQQGSYTQSNNPAAPPIFVAPSPLGTIANVAGQGIAAYQQDQQNKSEMAAGDAQTARFDEMIRRMRANQGQQPGMGAGGAPGMSPVPGSGMQPF